MAPFWSLENRRKNTGTRFRPPYDRVRIRNVVINPTSAHVIAGRTDKRMNVLRSRTVMGLQDVMGPLNEGLLFVLSGIRPFFELVGVCLRF